MDNSSIYTEMINQFWSLRRSKRITSKQADLYLFLLQESFTRGWENPFECANKSIILSIDMQEPTLIDARNRLKQLGLIDFIGGKRNESSPIYTLCYLNNLSRNRVKSIAKPEMNDEPSLPIDSKSITGREDTKPKKEGKKRNEFRPPSKEEVKKYFEENGYDPQVGEKAFLTYEAGKDEKGNWYDTKGNQVKNWKTKMLNVWFKPEHKAKPPAPVLKPIDYDEYLGRTPVKQLLTATR